MEPNQHTPQQNEPNTEPKQTEIPEPIQPVQIPVVSVGTAEISQHLEAHKKFISSKIVMCILAVIIFGALAAVFYVVAQGSNKSATSNDSGGQTEPVVSKTEEAIASRDVQRKNDLARLATALVSYQSNNRGALPGDDSDNKTWDNLVERYIEAGEETFLDPLGTRYILSTTTPLPVEFNSENPVIVVNVGYKCNYEQGISKATSARKVAFQMRLEDETISCQNN